MATKTPVPRKFVQDEFTHLPHEDQHPEQHEHTDVGVRPLVWFGIGFVVFALLTNAMLFVLFRVFERQESRPSSSAFGGAVQALPPGTPPLQGVPGPAANPRFHPNTPAGDMREWRQRTQRVLDEGDWSTQYKVIPIEQAMQIALQRQQDLFADARGGQGQQQQQQQGAPSQQNPQGQPQPQGASAPQPAQK